MTAIKNLVYGVGDTITYKDSCRKIDYTALENGTLLSKKRGVYLEVSYFSGGSLENVTGFSVTNRVNKNKFKLGDKVKVVDNKTGSCNKVGDIGVVIDAQWGNHARVMVDGRDNVGNLHYISDLELVAEPVGKTLEELEVKEGDIVRLLAIDKDCDNSQVGETLTIDERGYAVNAVNAYTPSCDKEFGRTYELVSRAADKTKEGWTLATPDYTPQDNHEVSYRMGVATHWREAVTIAQRVYVGDGKSVYISGTDVLSNYNATATLNGKTWTIELD